MANVRSSISIVASVLFAVMTSLPAGAQIGRDYIYVVGSSTVYPFATVIAERFGRLGSNRTPKVESTGSGGGLKLFCDGIGVEYPDVSNSSRAIKPAEIESCARNGVTDIIEIKIGYDGIVIANSSEAPPFALSRRDVYMALARWIPDGDGERLIDNPNRTWRDVNPTLPAYRLEILGPPPTSGTRDEFVELAMESGCMTFPWIVALRETDPDRFREICHTIREDGAFIEVGENDNLIVQKLAANPRAVGIFGFSFLDQNGAYVQGASIDGTAPTFEAIASGSYPVSRPLYFYVKKAHVTMVPGLRDFLYEVTSERAWGDDGYLSDRGLVPMPSAERREVAASVRSLTPLALAQD